MKIFKLPDNGPHKLMRAKYTEKDFDSLPWENLQVFGITLPCRPLLANRVFPNDAPKELSFALDCLVELLPNNDYWHASATLEFHGITDLKVNFGGSDSGFQNGPSPLLIAEVKRELIGNQKVHFDRLYYKWDIQLGNPSQTGHLTFGAYGFTLLIEKAVLSKPPEWVRNISDQQQITGY